MEIRNTNYNPNFTGIYKIKNGNKGIIEEIRDHLPEYVYVTRRPVHLFTGNHPMEPFIVDILSSVEESQRYSYSWVIQNAKNHGVKLPTLDNVDIWLTTGDDVKIVQEFLRRSAKAIAKADSFWGKLKSIFIKPADYDYSRNIPQYLKNLFPTLKRNDEMVGIYNDLIAGKKIVEAKNVQDLFFQMLKDTK